LRIRHLEDALVAPQHPPVRREVEEVRDRHDREADAQHRERAGVLEREQAASHRLCTGPRPREHHDRKREDEPADVQRVLVRDRRVLRLVVEQ